MHYQAEEKTKQIKHINTFQLFWSFPSPRENPFFPQYTAHCGPWTGKAQRACRVTVEPSVATAAAAQHSYWALPFWGKRGSQWLHCTEGSTETTAGPPNPVPVQDHSCSDPPPFFSYKHTYPNKWFQFIMMISGSFKTPNIFVTHTNLCTCILSDNTCTGLCPGCTLSNKISSI